MTALFTALFALLGWQIKYGIEQAEKKKATLLLLQADLRHFRALSMSAIVTAKKQIDNINDLFPVYSRIYPPISLFPDTLSVWNASCNNLGALDNDVLLLDLIATYAFITNCSQKINMHTVEYQNIMELLCQGENSTATFVKTKMDFCNTDLLSILEVLEKSVIPNMEQSLLAIEQALLKLGHKARMGNITTTQVNSCSH